MFCGTPLAAQAWYGRYIFMNFKTREQKGYQLSPFAASLISIPGYRRAMASSDRFSILNTLGLALETSNF
jgi:hypothetical protein